MEAVIYLEQHSTFFANQNNIEKFRAASIKALDILAIKSADIPKILELALNNINTSDCRKLVGDRQFYHRFKTMTNTKPNKTRLLALLCILHKMLSQKTNLTEQDALVLESINTIYDQLRSEQRFENPLNEKQFKSSLVSILSELGIDPKAATDVKSLFFRNETEIQRNFLTYRFSAKTAFIKKSFTAIINDPSRNSLRFANFIEHEGTIRVSRGIIIALEKQIAFVGSTDEGFAMKLMVMPKFAKPLDNYNGLMLTTEPDGDIVSAKMLLVETKYKNHLEAKVGEFPVEIIAEELESNSSLSIETIRNRIKFTMEEKLIDANNLPVEQHRMISIVDQLITGNGKYPVLRNQDTQQPFNPALDINYTFNSALKLKYND